jgi:hypothetical protein
MNLLRALFSRHSKSSDFPKAHPEVRVILTDLELDQRAAFAAGGLIDPRHYEPDGMEFRYESFNIAGEKVCSGKIDHILGMQVTVRYIETVTAHQRQGYGTAVLRWLSAYFGGLPIVPMDERGEAGVAFWAALRERPVKGLLVREQIGLTDASLLVQATGSRKR